ncbi:MAG: sigma-54-dependent Fis family transcriptional regulator [Planctomycetes bacterium]|nr:sigma-54-dependent Fis family transcriptional regulator [Planctomycetota bacterium]
MSARILAVDDSAENLTLIELYLQDTEFELVTARSAAEGLECVRRQDFDLFLLDVVMPGMDGFELCERLKADPRTREVPVIFLTGQVQPESQKLHAFEIGAVEYLARPIHGDELIARIRVMLRLREAVRSLEAENHAIARELQKATADLTATQSELQDLRRLVEGVGHARATLAWIDPEGRVVRCDDAGRARLAASGMDDADLRFEPLGEWITSGEPVGEVWLEVGGTSRCFALERIEWPAPEPNATLVALRDRTDEFELRRALEARRPRVPGPVEHGEVVEYTMTGCIGHSGAMREVHRMVDRLRNVRTTVLICGETGTGKELVARALHFDGRFKSAPFIPIHCGAISPNIIESELFGHEKGAFTGAERAAVGLFTAADRGTVFLDEISETTPDLQIKLLRVLQFGEVRPVGSTRSKQVDVRFLSATNVDLAERVREREFREDLFHRLNGIMIQLPPLRSRVEDILPIATTLLDKCARKYERGSKVTLSRAAADALEDYPWPGNVRELENVIDSLIALNCSDVVQLEELPIHVQRCEPHDLRRVDPGFGRASMSSDEIPSVPARRGKPDRRRIRDALERFGGDKAKAAKFLGISRATLYRRLSEPS